MDEVERADGTGNHDEVDRVGFCKKDRDITDGVVFKTHPESGSAGPAALLMIVDELFPASDPVFPLHRVQCRRVVHVRAGETEPMDRDPAYARDHTTKIVVVGI